MTATVSYALQTYTHTDYLRAATVYWGEAGAYVVNEFARLNTELFDDTLPPLPVGIGLTAYGACNAITRSRGHWDAGSLPRITIASPLFKEGRLVVTDTLIHEMLHAILMLRQLTPDHNAKPWCEAITRLSPAVLGFEIKAAPVNPRRIDGKLQRKALEDHIPRAMFARWPGSLRPASWSPGAPIDVETY